MKFIGDFFQYAFTRREEIWMQTLEHLWLTLTALALAILIGLSLGILITRKAKLATPVLAFVNAIQTVPSVALLGFLLPILGVGATPAIVALFLYSLLPIVRNTFTGINEIDPGIQEAALGLGMTDSQRLVKVELPLALPVIFAGIRTAFVISVGVATLCALIAAGGLGTFIFRGLTTNNTYMILAGAIPAGLMALTFDFLLGILQKHILRIIKPVALVFTFSLLFFLGGQVFTSEAPAFQGGFNSEFIERSDGLRGLLRTYNLDFEIVELEIGLMYQALHNENVDVIGGFSTDGRVLLYDLVILEDDRQYFPPYHAAPLMVQETLEKFPRLREAFARLDHLISDAEMAAMNNRVDHDKIPPKEVAREFLMQKGLKTAVVRNGDADIVIGSKNFTENLILAEMFKALIENYTSLTVELKLGFGGTKLVFDALNNREIDLYPEYTGTGLLVILQSQDSLREKVLYQKDAVYNFVRTEFIQQYGIEWLPPLGFNNTHALMMRREMAEELDLQSISDLSAYLQRP